MSNAGAWAVDELGDGGAPRSLDRAGPRVAVSSLDALLVRRATRLWWTTAGGFMLVALILHGSAWLAFPTIVTADTHTYCAMLHVLETGQYPDLSKRNIGYPLFMLACQALPGTLNRTLPLIQHLLELAAAVVVMVWMLRRWGVLASLMTGGLLLVSSYRAIWSQYGQPNALLCSVVPCAVVLLAGVLGRPGARWRVVGPFFLCLLVFTTREEVLLPVLAAPLVVLCFHRAARPACWKWFAMVAGLMAVAVIGRVWINHQSTGRLTYSTHAGEVFAWRIMHEDALVAPPRPAELERLYEAAATSGAAMRGGHYDLEDLWRAGRDRLGMTRAEAVEAMKRSAGQCVRRRPGAYVGAVLRDVAALWTNANPSLEWAAFEKSDPEKFHRDAAKLDWARHSREEFPVRYEPSVAQRVFRRLAFLRPGESFAFKPLVVCFLAGCAALVWGVGCRHRPFDRWWFLGLASAVVGLTVFYSAVAAVGFRYRMSIEWAFFAVASLGLVLPLRVVRRWLSNGQATSEPQPAGSFPQ